MTGDESGEQVRVLVVDDEPNIVDVISMALRFEGFAVDSAATGADAIAAVAANKPAVIVLDVMLPDIDGFEVARRMAGARTGVPIIFLTARDATEDVVHGLTLGGDDYMTKPFSLEELVARIRTVLRRAGLAEPESSKLEFADLELDEDTREVARGGRLLDHVWQYDFGGDARVLETYISYLRKKVDVEQPALIHTVRGVGYALRLPRG
jgi:two-component system OmpR family response regulator